MNNPFTIVAYLNDIKISTRLVKICQQNNFRLILPYEYEELPAFEPEDKGIVVIDIDDPAFYSPEIQWEARDKSSFPIIGIIEQIRRDWQEEALRGEFDLIIPKSLLEQNLSVVIKQASNGC